MLKSSINSAYIHIPFCSSICSYCDFCKMYYDERMVKDYLEALEREINSNYQGEELETIYIGGGTPSSLSLKELTKLFSILERLRRSPKCEFTIECNVENITEDKLVLFKKYGINRLSFGVQTIQQHLLTFLERNHTKDQVNKVINLAKEKGFFNINIDLMYALKNESIEDLKEDLDFFLSLQVPHISTYSLILEEHTKLFVNDFKPIEEDLDYEMYQTIQEYLNCHGYKQYEISNFCKDGYESKHNLTYWNNDEYYGFGLGASGYIDNIRYTNTRSINNYCKGKSRLTEEVLTKEDKMCYEMILGLGKIEGVSKTKFQDRYGFQIKDVFSYQDKVKNGLLVEDEDFVKIKKDKLYISNEIMLSFVKGD